MKARRSSGSILVLYCSGALWNVCLAMVQVLVPLYALSLGFSSLRIGGLVALPVLLQLMVRFLGSALADRFGERRILQGCYSLIGATGWMLSMAVDFPSLLLAQALANLSQATFWISSQSLVSQLAGGSMGRKLGRLSASNYGGSLIGLVLSGILAASFGYRKTFLVVMLFGVVCFLMGLALPHADPKPSHRSVWEIGAGIGRFLKVPRVWLVISISYAAALPISLTQSIYPIYLAGLNYGDQWIGTTLSIRGVGPVLIGSLLGSYITMTRRKGIYALGMTVLGVFLASSGMTDSIWIIAVSIGMIGAAGSMMDLLYQVQAAELSGKNDRSVAMASMGLGWNFSYLTMPIFVTWLAETAGFSSAFLISGCLFLLIGAGSGLWHRLLEPADSAAEKVSVMAPSSGL